MASKRNGTLYVGSTFDLIKRGWEHKNKVIPGFTAQYNVQMLVYYETHSTYINFRILILLLVFNARHKAIMSSSSRYSN